MILVIQLLLLLHQRRAIHKPGGGGGVEGEVTQIVFQAVKSKSKNKSKQTREVLTTGYGRAMVSQLVALLIRGRAC